MKTKNKFVPKDTRENSSNPFKPALIGASSAVICTLLLSLLITLLILRSPDPDNLTKPSAYLILALSLICAGIVSSRISKRNLVSCALSGGMFALIGLFVHIAINGGTGFFSILYLSFPLISTLSGMIAGPKDKKRGTKFTKRKF